MNEETTGIEVERATRKAKRLLVEQFGGGCQSCGYNRCLRALQFHHKDASEKEQWSKSRGGASNREVRAHPERFLLLCATCHIEEHERLDEANRVIAECQACGKRFQTKACLLANGKGKFCGKRCQHVLRNRNIPETVAPRFWKKVIKTDGCWTWTGSAQKGTPMLNMQRHDGTWGPRTAASISWKLHFGPVPEGREVTRTCQNPSCVRPDHLRLTDRAEIVKLAQDGWVRKAKGRRDDDPRLFDD